MARIKVAKVNLFKVTFFLASVFLIVMCFSRVAFAAYGDLSSKLPDDAYRIKLPNGQEAQQIPDGPDGVFGTYDDCYQTYSYHGDCTTYSYGSGDSHQYITLSNGQIDDSTRDADYIGANYTYFTVITNDNCSVTSCYTTLSVDLVERGIGSLACQGYGLQFDYYNPRVSTQTSMAGRTITSTGCNTRGFPDIPGIPTSAFAPITENNQATGQWKAIVRVMIVNAAGNRQASFHLRSSSNAKLGYAGRIVDTNNNEKIFNSSYAGWLNTYPTNAADGHRVEYSWRPRCDKQPGSTYQIAWDDLDYPSSFQPSAPSVKLWKVDSAGNHIGASPIDTFTPGSSVRVETITMTSAMYAASGQPYALSLEFSGIRGGNGISFWQPFDSNLSKLDCPPPQPPVGGVSGQCQSTTAKNGNGSGAGEYYTTPLGNVYKTNTLVTIDNVTPAVSSGYTNSGGGFGNGQVGFGATKTWSYTPTAASITIHSKLIYHNTSTGNWGTVPGSDTSQTVNCFVAECFVTSVVGDGPGGIVLAGGVAHITFQINNNPSYQPLPASINGHPLGIIVSGNPSIPPSGVVGYGIPPGGYGYVFVDLAMPAGASSYTFNGTLAYIGGFNIYSPCGSAPAPTTFPTYEHFHFTAQAFTTMSPTEENPTSVGFLSYVDRFSAGSEGTIAVPAPMSSSFTTSPPGICPSGSPTSASGSGPWAAGVGSQVLNGSCTPTSVSGGDTYCTAIHLDYSDGWINQAGDVQGANTPVDISPCKTVHNKPIVKAYGSTISSGGDFSVDNTNCNSPGALGSWYNNDSGNYGASAQLGAIALSNIKGFASAYGSISGPPLSLTFANTGPGVTTSTNLADPALGGNYGGTHCLTLPTEPVEAASHDPGSNPAVGALFAGGNKHVGNLTLGGGVIATGKNVSLFVDGDVHITGDIQYQSGGWLYTANGTTVPSFVLVATGNIYIDNGVTLLEGSYVAHHKADGSGGSIFTCSNGGFGPMGAANLYAGCNNQLTVFGAFTAVNIKNMRTFGSLRDEQSGSAATCSNAGVRRSPETCAAEVYKFSPELQLTLPAIRPPNNGTTQYQAITSLPPVL